MTLLFLSPQLYLARSFKYLLQAVEYADYDNVVVTLT